MVNELTKLYNTMMLIETKGENSKTMADCLRFVENLIKSEQNKPAPAPVEPAEPVEEIPEE